MWVPRPEGVCALLPARALRVQQNIEINGQEGLILDQRYPESFVSETGCGCSRVVDHESLHMDVLAETKVDK